MKLLTWNIQCGKGCDGITDLARIVSIARATADAEMLCFQEVARHFANFEDGADQAAVLAALLPGYTPVFRPAVEAMSKDGTLHQFGNMTLTRLPILQVTNHLLPWPGAGSIKSMRRAALEVVVETSFGPLRVTNTHLEYYSADQREAQIKRLIELQEQASMSPRTAKTRGLEPYDGQTIVGTSVLCGDFNFDVSDPQHALIQSAGNGIRYRDAWTIVDPQRPRQPTCGIYDRVHWNGPDCRDFIFVSEDLSDRVRQIIVNTETDASDHQPVTIELGGGEG